MLRKQKDKAHKKNFEEITVDNVNGIIPWGENPKKRVKSTNIRFVFVGFVLLVSVVVLMGGIKQNSFGWLKDEKNKNMSDIGWVEHDSFTGDIVEVKDIIMAQQRSYQPYMSWSPLEYNKQFESLQDAFEYLGNDISYMMIEQDTPATVKVFCNKSGEIETIIVMTDYEYDGNNVQIWYYIFTDLNKIPGKESLYTKPMNKLSTLSDTDNVVSEIKELTSELARKNIQVPISIFEMSAEGIEIAESRFTLEKITYLINVAAKTENKRTAEETLKEILQRLE